MAARITSDSAKRNGLQVAHAVGGPAQRTDGDSFANLFELDLSQIGVTERPQSPSPPQSPPSGRGMRRGLDGETCVNAEEASKRIDAAVAESVFGVLCHQVMRFPRLPEYRPLKKRSFGEAHCGGRVMWPRRCTDRPLFCFVSAPLVQSFVVQRHPLRLLSQ